MRCINLCRCLNVIFKAKMHTLSFYVYIYMFLLNVHKIFINLCTKKQLLNLATVTIFSIFSFSNNLCDILQFTIKKQTYPFYHSQSYIFSMLHTIYCFLINTMLIEIICCYPLLSHGFKHWFITNHISTTFNTIINVVRICSYYGHIHPILVDSIIFNMVLLCKYKH